MSMDEIDTELFEERAAIMEYDGGLSREEAEYKARIEVEAKRHACEVKYVLALENAEKAAYFDLCRKRRGDAATERLRADVIEAYRAAAAAGHMED
ncbi:MAG: hypothetical protein IPM06_17725 [Rhizobiales bacterium]|nr:hypothetical protein [Hyphomicrobiales bacterium]